MVIEDGSHRLTDIIYSIKHHFSYIKSGGYLVLEDYKHPNYFDDCNDDKQEIKIDILLKKLKNKEIFQSNILNNDDQVKLFSSIGSINEYKGATEYSDICFIRKL